MTVAAEQTPKSRVVIESLDREFARLHERSCELVLNTPFDSFYRSDAFSSSTGENLLRSAAVVEQTFGGLTVNLWDDPFEWTLPETLSTRERVLEYLEEVEETRRKAFAGFVSDDDLTRQIAVPSENFATLVAVLVDALVRSTEYLGRATKAVTRTY